MVLGERLLHLENAVDVGGDQVNERLTERLFLLGCEELCVGRQPHSDTILVVSQIRLTVGQVRARIERDIGWMISRRRSTSGSNQASPTPHWTHLPGPRVATSGGMPRVISGTSVLGTSFGSARLVRATATQPRCISRAV
jgi:hypothetical protein